MSNIPQQVVRIDPRESRFAAALGAVLIVTAFACGPVLGLPLLVLQASANASGSLLGLRHEPYGWLFRRVFRPHLGAPPRVEDERPHRLAQGIMLWMVLVAGLGTILGAPVVFYGAGGLALAASLLPATIGFRLSPEPYSGLGRPHLTN